MSFPIPGLTNGTLYYVRVYIRCTYGWQTSVDAIASATPMAGIEISTLAVGGKVKIDVNGTPYNFLKVHQGLPSSMYDASCNGAWMLMEPIYENFRWGSSNDYANSDINANLNSTIFNVICANVRNYIKQVKIPYRPGRGTSMNVNSGANGLLCKIISLSYYELGFSDPTDMRPIDGSKLEYFEKGLTTSANYKRVGYFNGVATTWSSRTPITDGNARISVVNSDGIRSNTESNGYFGIRPAFILPSDFLLSPTPNPDGSYSPLLA